MKLSYEDAMFYKLILQGGYHKEVNDWIDNVSENNDLLEGIYLDIVSNQENLNELISCLHNYVVEKEYNDKIVRDRLQSFIKDKLNKNEISCEEAANSLCGFAIHSEKWLDEIWNDFYMLSVYGDYMDGGFLEKEDYHKIISEFVNTGELLNPDDFWQRRLSKKNIKIVN